MYRRTGQYCLAYRRCPSCGTSTRRHAPRPRSRLMTRGALVDLSSGRRAAHRRATTSIQFRAFARNDRPLTYITRKWPRWTSLIQNSPTLIELWDPLTYEGTMPWVATTLEMEVRRSESNRLDFTGTGFLLWSNLNHLRPPIWLGSRRCGRATAVWRALWADGWLPRVNLTA